MTSEQVERANGEIWSAIRTLLEQGAAIQQDYAAGKYEGYEHYSARLDEAARERVEWLKERASLLPQLDEAVTIRRRKTCTLCEKDYYCDDTCTCPCHHRQPCNCDNCRAWLKNEAVSS